MKTCAQFATREQRAAWRAECERNATRRMLCRLVKQLSRLAQEPVPTGQSRLAANIAGRAPHILHRSSVSGMSV